MTESLVRTALLLGENAVSRLGKCRVAVFGVGGVGGHCVEALARSGIGALDLIDSDTVCLSNLNRQIIALHSTVGRLKVDAAAERIRDINPDCKVTVYPVFYLPETRDQFDFRAYDYVVDCIDTVKAKIELARRCHRLGLPIIASMGAARKTDPTAFCVTDLAKTQGDPLAKVIRKTLRKEGINHMKVVYSQENDSGNDNGNDNVQPFNHSTIQPSTRPPLPSCAFVPAAAGIIIGGEVVKDLIKL